MLSHGIASTHRRCKRFHKFCTSVFDASVLASVLQGHWLQTHSAHRLTHALYSLLQWQPQLLQ